MGLACWLDFSNGDGPCTAGHCWAQERRCWPGRRWCAPKAATTLKFIPYADLALLDPAVSAFVTRNHVLMVFDTLFALDENGVAQPQMLEGSIIEADGLTWTLTLRDGLRFHDGTPVLARDAVASIKRWWVNDAFGQALAAATDELRAPDDKTIRFRLKRRFHLLPDALAHPTNTMAAIMPERLANTPAEHAADRDGGQRAVPLPRCRAGAGRAQRLCEVRGLRAAAGRGELHAPGRGSRISTGWNGSPRRIRRPRWPRCSAGEVDLVEQPLMDLVPALRANRALKVEVVETKGLIGFLRFNQLFPPFDNPAIRRAVLKAVNQQRVHAGGGRRQRAVRRAGGHVHAGHAAGQRCRDGGAERQARRRSPEAGNRGGGLQGREDRLPRADDVPRINAIAEVGADMLRKLGMNVDVIATDWGTTVQRSVSRQPPDQGGWHMFAAFTGG